MRNRIADIGGMIRLSRETMRNIRQNVLIALGLRVVFLVTAVTGISGLWIACFADTGATVLVTLNAMRLLGFGRDQQLCPGRMKGNTMSDTIALAERINLAEHWKIGLTRQNDDSWLISFADAAGTARPVLIPALSVEAISSDQIVRNLKLRPAGASGAVAAEGWVEFATHARISVLTPEGSLRIQHRFADAPAVLADVGPRGGFLTDMGHGANVELVKRRGVRLAAGFLRGRRRSPCRP